MKELTKEAFEFRGRMLNEGGNLKKMLARCLKKDSDTTNCVIQVLNDEYHGELTFECALMLAGACRWIMAGKPDDIGDLNVITVRELMQKMC